MYGEICMHGSGRGMRETASAIKRKTGSSSCAPSPYSHYNPHRLHSALDYQSPVAYEEEYLQRVAA